MCGYFQYLFINPCRPGQTDPTFLNPTLLDAVEKCRTTTRWPNECNVLDPAFWTQGSGTKIYPESLESKLSRSWRFQVTFKIVNRVTFSDDSKRTAVPESGNCNSKCAVLKGLSPGVRNLDKHPGRHFAGSPFPGSCIDLQMILQMH